MEPNRSNDYQLPSWPPTALTRDLFNAIFRDIAMRLAARENLEASFEDLIAQGIQSSLDYIQVNVGPQLAALQAAIEEAEDRIDEIIVDGTAPNSAKLGGQLPAFYATAQALMDGLALKTNDADFETRTRTVVAELTGNAPAALDTIYELAAAIGNDPNIRQTLLNAIALKFDKTGGKLSGSPLIEAANPLVGFKQMTGPNAGGQGYLHLDGVRIGVLDATFQWLFWVDLTNGSAWFKGIGDLSARITTQANAARDAAIASSMGFSSGQLTPTLGGLIQAAHGLGVPPRYYQAFLQCINAEAGYSPGDEVQAPICDRGATDGHGVSVWTDSINIYGRCGNSDLGYILNKATGSVTNILPANWRVVLRAKA